MQEATKGLNAEVVVGLGIENELVPEIIGDLRRHGNGLEATLEVSQEELLQGLSDQLAISGCKTWVLDS